MIRSVRVRALGAASAWLWCIACAGTSPTSPSAVGVAGTTAVTAAATAAEGGNGVSSTLAANKGNKPVAGTAFLQPLFGEPGLPEGAMIGFEAVPGGRVVRLGGDIVGTNFEAGVCNPGIFVLPNGLPSFCLVFGDGPGQFKRAAPGGVAFTTCNCSVGGVGSPETTQVTLKISYPPATPPQYPGGFTKFTFQHGTGALKSLQGQGTLDFAQTGQEVTFTYHFTK